MWLETRGQTTTRHFLFWLFLIVQSLWFQPMISCLAHSAPNRSLAMHRFGEKGTKRWTQWGPTCLAGGPLPWPLPQKRGPRYWGMSSSPPKEHGTPSGPSAQQAKAQMLPNHSTHCTLRKSKVPPCCHRGLDLEGHEGLRGSWWEPNIGVC